MVTWGLSPEVNCQTRINESSDADSNYNLIISPLKTCKKFCGMKI